MDDATQDTEQIERQLNVLLEEIESTATSVTGRVSDESPGLSYADLTKESQEDEVAGDIVGPGEEPADEVDEEVVEPEEASAGDADSPEGDDLEAAVEEMLQQAVDENASPEQAQALDDELARLGDELLAKEDSDPPPGDVEAPEETEIHDELDDAETSTDDAPPPPPEATEGEPADDAVAEELVTAVAATEPEPQPKAPGPESVIKAAPKPIKRNRVAKAPLPAEPWPKALAIARIVVLETWFTLTWLVRVIHARAPVYWSRAKPQAIRVMVLTSKPIARRSPMVRSAVGYIAIVTAFWAMIVIFFVVIRNPSEPAPTEPRIGLEDGT